MKQGRVVVITGAAGGIGAALVERFLANGDRVVALDHVQNALDNLAARGFPPDRIAYLTCDVSREDSCTTAAAAVEARFGRVDVLVNAAGVFPTCRVEDMTLEAWRTVIDINLTGTFLIVRAMIPLIKARGWGRIVNLGSATVFGGPSGRAHYVASKSGVIGLSRCLASELGDYGITVNVVTPGLTVTEAVTRDTPAELIERVRTIRPVKRDQQASDVTGAVFFLASPEADFITGQTLNVDGGMNKH